MAEQAVQVQMTSITVTLDGLFKLVWHRNISSEAPIFTFTTALITIPLNILKSGRLILMDKR